MEDEASSHHVQCSIELAEPVLFQKGFNLGGQSSPDEEQKAILRGKLVLRIAKAVKLKTVRLDFTGRSRTERHRGTRYLLPMNISSFLNHQQVASPRPTVSLKRKTSLSTVGFSSTHAVLVLRKGSGKISTRMAVHYLVWECRLFAEFTHLSGRHRSSRTAIQVMQI